MIEIVNLSINGMQYAVKKEEWGKVLPQNQQTVIKYDLQNKRDGLSNNTRANNLSFIIGLSKKIQKPYHQINRKDLNSYSDALELSDTTKAQYIIMIRKFFKWLHHKKNPDCIRDLNVVNVKSNKLKFSDMLTEDDIQKLIDAYPDPQHKALVSVLYDSACRCGEIVGLNREHVVCNNGQWVICVDGKTGVRNIPLTLSCHYLEPWFNTYHPFKTDKTAPLFLSISNREKYKKAQDRRLGVPAVWSLLKQGTEASGITKEIHPHLLRHSRLTWLSDHGMSENMMRLYAGWTNGSNMPAVYLHTNPADIAVKIHQIQGSASPEEMKPEPSKLLPKKCPRCKAQNDVSSPYCKQCWLPLDIKVGLAETLMVDLIRSTWYDVVSREHTIQGEYVPIEEMAEHFQEFKQNTQRALGKGEIPDGVKRVAQKLLEARTNA